MSKIEFFLSYTLKPKQSMRVWAKQGKDGKPVIIKHKDLGVIKDEKNMASLLVKHLPPKPFDCTLRMTCIFHYAWLQKHKPNMRIGCPLKGSNPDCENLAKGLLDTMERMGFFVNDSRVADLRIIKIFADRPGVRVILEPATHLEATP